MNLDKLKMTVKSSPRLECIYMCLMSLKDKEECKKIIGTKRNPYNLILNRYGDNNPDKWIYYINFDVGYRYNGFCSLYRLLLLHLAYADDLGFVPVVNWGANTLYFDSTYSGIKNVFEYYFMSLSDIDEAAVLSSRNVIVSKGFDAGAFGTTGSYAIPDEEIELAAQIRKKYIRLNAQTECIIEDKIRKFTSDSKTLGVHVRATDFNKGYNRHPIVITPEEYLAEARAAVIKYGFNKVFLATDDENVVQLFQKEFKDLLVYYSDVYRSKDGEAIHYGDSKSKREHHKYLLGLEIIRDFYTLGACAGLIAGNSNVSMCALILKRSFEESYQFMKIIDKGVNHNMKETRSLFGKMLKKEADRR